MVDRVITNNIVEITGKAVSEYTFSHQIYGESFYSLGIEVTRLSNSVDVIPIIISERLVDIKENILGKYVIIKGQFRSYNKHENNKSRLILSVFTREIEFLDENINKNPNTIFIDGYICKPPVYRTTPFGREITDLLIAVNRPYNKSDYIPAIAWGRNAKYAEKFNVGERMKVWGRIQSRNYQKKQVDGTALNKVAYEVSVSKLEEVEEE